MAQPAPPEIPSAAVTPDLTAIAARFRLRARSITPIDGGLINRTWSLTDDTDARWILQAVNPIFAPEVNLDIDAVTAHLAARGVPTPRLRRTSTGGLWITVDDAVYRVMTHLNGEAHDRLANPAQAEEAGAALARFHRALADLEHTFAARRLGVHDTAKHLATLAEALVSHAQHSLHGDVAALAEEIQAHCHPLSDAQLGPERVVHGDPKINNLLFDDDGHATAFIDLDTVAPMALPLELGDALRSWCNAAASGEDDDAPTFTVELFAAAIRGYAAHGAIAEPQREAIPDAVHTIMLELAARFAADALRESYFGWDAERFTSRGAHNLVRAKGQVALARSFREQRRSIEEATKDAFAGR